MEYKLNHQIQSWTLNLSTIAVELAYAKDCTFDIYFVSPIDKKLPKNKLPLCEYTLIFSSLYDSALR